MTVEQFLAWAEGRLGHHELTSGEISQVLGIPEGSVRTRLWRGREILREKLAALLEPKHAR